MFCEPSKKKKSFKENEVKLNVTRKGSLFVFIQNDPDWLADSLTRIKLTIYKDPIRSLQPGFRAGYLL